MILAFGSSGPAPRKRAGGASRRWAALALSALALIAAAPADVAAAPRFASFVMDARDGSVLHSERADERLHPASLTKMMTLYLAFEAVESGRISLDQTITISRRAAQMQPSKLGMRPGQRIPFRELIRAAAIKSGNDAAVALAEAIAGSEERFAEFMTIRAAELGMSRTTFRNASGLTAKGHLSTARDMALLSRRLFYDFPQYYNIFGRKTSRAGGKSINNTNRLLRTYRGADGIKTGYTRAAGFNLASSAVRGSERIIAVVFGARSSDDRARRVSELLDLGFRLAPSNVPVRRWPLVEVARAPVPERRPGATAGSTFMASSAGDVLIASVRGLGDAIAPPAAASNRVPEGTIHAPQRMEPPLRRPGAAQLASGRWGVQIGAFDTETQAIAELTSVALADISGLETAATEVSMAEGGGEELHRARFLGVDERTALSACRRIVALGRPCATVPPGSW